MKKLLLIALTLVLFASCEDYAPVPMEPFQLPKIAFDVDGDNINDFLISYREYASNDEPSSRGSIIGSIHPLNGHELLYHSAGGYLFLNHMDKIHVNAESPVRWFDYGADLIDISREYTVWDDQWKIVSQKDQDYALAFKTHAGGSTRIGYVTLDFDINTGEVHVLSRTSTSEPVLTVVF